ncbi:uncharacterized protein LOC111916187 [Lactuca sativa]|uniref:Legume lectin domain-containing protein n=1 Tax=Lactuca sativa TaxID=4236 RepID=A0A9R1WZX8_LACSA|nr:uncharacterized protein LOC111916187 [Lactuca sativa]KAJ0192999.1 hypothetical protein LSAT_V11C800435670 [Lactuca sativa]
MASTTAGVLLFAALIGVLAISTTARPCKTIFFITSSSSHYPTDDPFLPKPNFHILRNPNNSPRLTFFVTEIREFHRTRSLPRSASVFDRSIESSSSDDVVSSVPYYSATSTSVKASIRERTMDIMSIVGALLFGVGCGALTAATMYLIWSLFAPRRFDFGADSDEESDDEENGVRSNSNGYVAIPAVAKPVPPTADEVAAMK